MQGTWHVRNTYFRLAPLNRLYPGADELFSCLGRTQLQILNTKMYISVIKVFRYILCFILISTKLSMVHQNLLNRCRSSTNGG